jgi:hypothetical protein
MPTTSDRVSDPARAVVEPIGDPDEAGDDSDFAEEHEETVVDPDEPDSGETESPDRYSGGLDREGPP